MAFSDADYTTALAAVNDATNHIGTVLGKLSDIVTGVGTRVQALADKLNAAPSAADVKTAAAQMTAHAGTLNGAADLIDQAESTLQGIAANPAVPVPDTPPIVVPDVPPPTA